MGYEISGIDGDIYQSLNTLFATPVGTLAFDREYGISWDGIDSPPDVALSMLAAEITEKTERYEPRAVIEDVISETGTDGKSIVRIVVSYAGTQSAPA